MQFPAESVGWGATTQDLVNLGASDDAGSADSDADDLLHTYMDSVFDRVLCFVGFLGFL